MFHLAAHEARQRCGKMRRRSLNARRIKQIAAHLGDSAATAMSKIEDDSRKARTPPACARIVVDMKDGNDDVDTVVLANFKIGGNVDINNGDGGSFIWTRTQSAAAGFNNIAGNVTITNGTGLDTTDITDTNVGGNVTANRRRRRHLRGTFPVP